MNVVAQYHINNNEEANNHKANMNMANMVFELLSQEIVNRRVTHDGKEGEFLPDVSEYDLNALDFPKVDYCFAHVRIDHLYVFALEHKRYKAIRWLFDHLFLLRHDVVDIIFRYKSKEVATKMIKKLHSAVPVALPLVKYAIERYGQRNLALKRYYEETHSKISMRGFTPAYPSMFPTLTPTK